MEDPGIPSSSTEQPSNSFPHLLHLSRHASVSPQPLTDHIPTAQASWTGRIRSGLGQWWSNQRQRSSAQPAQAMVVSSTNADIAIIDGYQITFLSSANGFQHAVQSSVGNTEAGFYTCGVWLEDSGFFATMTSFNCMVMMDRSGKEVSRVSSGWWKTSAYALAMFAERMQNNVGEERYKLVVFASDCSICRIEYGPKGFGGLGSGATSHTFIKKVHPQEVTGYVYNRAKSCLALVGPSGIKYAGTCCISLWRVQDFWQSVELLGYVDDVERDSSVGMGLTKGSSIFSQKLIISPSCSYIGLLDSGLKMQVVIVNQVPNWKLEKLNFHSETKNEIRDNERLQESIFPYFEVASERGISKTADFENPWGIQDACWWDDNTLFLLKVDGLLVIASLPDLQTISKFHARVLDGGMHISYGSQRCIYVLESILDKEQHLTAGTGSVAESGRGGWRLLRMKEHTVFQLFKIILENRDFDFALDIANRYNLDIDSVYKSQWLCSDWSQKAVQQSLSKVKDRKWVLKECLERVCPSMEAMDGLLRHGIRLIDSFVGPMSVKHAAQDPAVGHLCLSRLRLLQYNDRLETYLGLSMDRYTPKDYEVFRSSPLEDVAVRLAESGKTGAVSLLYKRHIYSLTSCLLKILDALPETQSPQSYAHLLPSASPFTPYIVGRERDWVEGESFIDIIKKYNVESGAVNPTDSTEHMVKASIGFVWPSEVEIIEWYKKRASAIDRLSGQLENALNLIDLGKQKGISGLDDLWEDLSSLHWVTYNNSEADEGTEINWNLEGWQLLTDYEKFHAMLMGVTDSNVLEKLNEKAIPFMNQKVRKISANHQDQELSFLVKWMKEMAEKDQLHICAVILIEACKDIRSNRLFNSELECINTGLECVYICSGTDQWDTMEKILTKLSQSCLQLQPNSLDNRSSALKQIGRGASRVSPFSMYPRSAENMPKSDAGITLAKENVYAALDRKIHKALGHVDAGRLLFNYQVPKPIKFLENAQSDERAVKQLILSMLSKFARRQPARTDADWATMWDHLQRLQAKAFTFLNRQFLFMEYCSSLLKAGKFTLAKSQLKALGNNLLSSEKIETVIIQVSRDYLFSASTLDSLEIEKARLCLGLVPESKNIASELDYIETVTNRLPALGVFMLPLQVKQTKDSMEIVKRALINSSSEGAFPVDDVLDIARSLGLNSEEQIDEVKEAIARQAAASGQISLALHLCLGLMRRGHKAVWELCAALARGPELEEINLQLRKELLGFAISHCDDSSISQLLLTWKELDFSERCMHVKEAMELGGCGGNAFDVGFSLKADLQQQDDQLPENLRNSLCKVAHLDGNFPSKVQKNLLRILSSYLPWLLQAANVDFQKFDKAEHDDMDLLVKSVATILLGLAHNNLPARDELICPLARLALSRLSREEDLIGLGYLLNLSDNSRATNILEEEMHREDDLKKNHKVLRVAFKYGSLLQKGMVGSLETPRARRERLLEFLREPDGSSVSGNVSEDGSSPKNVWWSQWQSKILKDLNAARHSLELNSVVANFNMDQFVSGDQEYMVDVIKSLIKSSATLESPEVDQNSRVLQYQISNRFLCCSEESDRSYKLNVLDLESNFKMFEKHLKHLDAMERWVFIQTVMTETAKAVLEETAELREDECMKKLCSLVHFWVIVVDSFGGENKSNALSSQAKRASELRFCCESFEKLMRNKMLSGSLSREVIAKVVDSPSSEEETSRFFNAMVASGCAFQMVVFVWQHAMGIIKDEVFSNDFSTEISAIYVEVVSASINTCSASCQSLSFNQCFHQLDPMLKAVASLNNLESVDNSQVLQDPGIVSLHEVRLYVWKAISEFAENMDIPSPLRVSLLKLREAIIFGHQQKYSSHGFDDHLSSFSVMWVGWDMSGLVGERAPPLQHTIIALKSTELLSTAWQDLSFNAEDLVSVEAATSAFNGLTTKAEHAQHAVLLIRLLEGWGDIFGWEGNAEEKEPRSLAAMKEKVDRKDTGWGDGDGWDDVWDDSEVVINGVELEERESGAVSVLHACWKTALAKLASFRDGDLLLQAMDRVHLRNGRTVLNKEESFELVALLAEEDAAVALKVSLLLPYKDCQDRALESFDSRIKADDSVSGEDDKKVLAVDECLLVLVLAAGRLSIWVDEGKFAALFCILSGLLSCMIQRGEFSSVFVRDVAFPYFLASLTTTSKYRVASALALQSMRVPPAFITWNSAYVSLRRFVEVRASIPCEESNTPPLNLQSLSCIGNSVQYLQNRLHEKLNSTLQFLSNTSL